MEFRPTFRRIKESARNLTGNSRAPLLALRVTSLVLIVALLTLHLRSLRVFRWEHSVTGGIIVTYFVATVGLTLCAGVQGQGATAFKAYLSGTGSVLLALNAAGMWRRWRRAGELTHVVAELLAALGVQLRRQVRCKVLLSIAASASLLVDLILTPFLVPELSAQIGNATLNSLIDQSMKHHHESCQILDAVNDTIEHFAREVYD